ncbi:MAG: 50S ribosomal protein L9, partial [Chloroflexota bacterium]
MKVILRQDVNNLGKMGDIVNVKDGFARNYLLPREMAYFATPGAINRLESEKKQYAGRLAREKGQAEV